MSAKFAPITTVADLRATTHARPGLVLYGLLELRRATDRCVAELERRVQQQLSAPGALSDEAVDAIDVLCAAIQEISELRDALEQQIHGVRSGRRLSMRKRLR